MNAGPVHDALLLAEERFEGSWFQERDALESSRVHEHKGRSFHVEARAAKSATAFLEHPADGPEDCCG